MAIKFVVAMAVIFDRILKLVDCFAVLFGVHLAR